MVSSDRIITILNVLEKATEGMPKPLIQELEGIFGKDSFITLIACLLSLRSRDVITLGVCKKLFERVRSPEELISVPLLELEQMLHSVGFYRKKARIIREVSHELIDRFNSAVPWREEELLSLKGVGRKTANLVRGTAFGIPAICVDVHVHQITNRLGWVITKTPEETERALMQLIPEEYWISLNYLLVVWGQNICVSVSPWCSRCAIRPWCPQIGVIKKR